MKFAFNTGRHYTSKGQRIAAWVENNGPESQTFIVFIDFDRDITGAFELRSGLQGPMEHARHVIYMYDHCQYGGIYEHGFDLVNKVQGIQCNGYDAFITDKDCVVLAGVL